jgi:hypothetical protein
MTLADVPFTVACPACAQQPGEWCAVWKDQSGMVAEEGLCHPERVEAQTFRDAPGDRIHLATKAEMKHAVDKLV